MRKRHVDLSIIILNYNTASWLENALRSIKRYPLTRHSFEVIVVDNHSSDHSVAMVQATFPSVTLIEAPENGGFARGNNIGIKVANGKYIMLLNSDAEFNSDTNLDACLEYFEQHEQVGVMTPQIVLADGGVDLACHRGEPTPWAAITYFLGFEKRFPESRLFGQYHQTWKDFKVLHTIDACSGAAMLVRAQALQKVGDLDEQFFMYAEDLDWCRRFREHKYQIIYFPQSRVVHHKYKSGLAKRKDILEPNIFLQIPGFSHKKDLASSTRHHFFQTMKQYYSKHYQKSSPIQTLIIHRIIDLLHWWKQTRS